MTKQTEYVRAVKRAVLSIADDYLKRTGKKKVNSAELARFLGKAKTGQAVCYRWVSEDEKYAERIPEDFEWNRVEDFFGVTHGEIARRADLSDAPTIDLSALIEGTLRITGTPVNLAETTATTIVSLISNDDENLNDDGKRLMIESYAIARKMTAAARTNTPAKLVAPAAQPTFAQESLLQNAS